MKMITFLFLVVFCFACSNEKHLTTEKIGDGSIPEDEPEIHGLFSKQPGTWVALKSIGGAVDPVGTTLANDFDGDGIDNSKETTTNEWVADYPSINTYVAPPVTMKITVLDTLNKTDENFSSEIDTSDVTSNMNFSTEAIHRTETGYKTITFEDTSKTNDIKGRSYSGSGMLGGLGGGGSYSKFDDKSIETKTTKWETIPRKDKIDQHGSVLKRDQAASNARKFKNEVRSTCTAGYQVKPNAGYIRASLYLHNDSVNMPVKLKNIVCSFMLEDPAGQLIPVQSFRLRNDDYSLFEISLYGGEDFGPYVIELKDLNTSEIRDAILKGYNPKVFIVDYEMSHVDDSNYRQALSANFTGDNLKIIEENAKGRTAGIRFVGPQIREFYRVVAFDSNGNEKAYGSTGVTSVSPGVSLEKALKRISYSGRDIQFTDYVLDFTDVRNGEKFIDNPRFAGFRYKLRAIKSFAGVESCIPASQMITENGSTTVVMKPFSQWTDDDYASFKVWVVFDKGKYFRYMEPVTGAGGMISYTYTDTNSISMTVPVVNGLQGTIWPGDHYDIVFLSLRELLQLQNQFGTNSLELNSAIQFNTRWNSSELGEYPFRPQVKSVYLGEATCGDIIEFRIKLKDTICLNPSFGQGSVSSSAITYNSFSYNWKRSTDGFQPSEALDFELCFGVGAAYTEWVNLTHERYSKYVLTNKMMGEVKTSWNYVDQELTVKVPIPDQIAGVDDTARVRLYLRPALNNAYRETIWPLPPRNNRSFTAMLASDVKKNCTVLPLVFTAGIVSANDRICLMGLDGEKVYTAVSEGYSQNGKYFVTLSNSVSENHLRGEQVYVNSYSENSMLPKISLRVSSDFISQWNTDHNNPASVESITGLPLLTGDADTYPVPARYLGLPVPWMTSNWTGANSFGNPSWNGWTDAGLWKSFEDSTKRAPLAIASNSSTMSIQYGSGTNSQLLLNNINRTGSQSNPRIAVSGSRSLVVWESNHNGSNNVICGRLRDLSTGFIGDEFVVSTSEGDHVYPWIAASNDRAIVVWRSYTSESSMINVRVMNLRNGEWIANEISLETTSEDRETAPIVTVSGSRALVAWMSGYNGTDYDIRGRVIDLNTQTCVGDIIQISTTNNSNEWLPSVASSGSRAFVAWMSVSSDNDLEDADIRGRVIDLGTGIATGDRDISVSTTNVGGQIFPDVAMSGNRAFVVWSSNDNGIDYDIRGRVIDVDNRTGTSEDFLVSLNNIGEQNLPHIKSFNDNNALLVWWSVSEQSDVAILGNVRDIRTGSGVDNEFIISNNQEVDPFNISVTVLESEKRAITVFQTSDGINYHLIDLNSLRGIGNDFMINDATGSTQNLSNIVLFGKRAFVVWESNNSSTSNDINGVDIDLVSSMKRFFVSPMIERNYEVNAKIVE